MIRLRLSRDQARHIERDFFPYMLMVCKMKVREAIEETEDYFTYKMILSLIHDVDVAFKKKLLTSSHTFNFNFSDAHGLCLYRFMMKQPINENVVYSVILRQMICDALFQQLLSYTKYYEE